MKVELLEFHCKKLKIYLYFFFIHYSIKIMAERVLPSSIDYSKVLPLSVPALSKRRKYFPSNGSTFTAAGNSEIRIELPNTNALLDPAHSYLEFEVLNQHAIQTVGIDIAGAACLFSQVRLEQGGKVICDSQSYNRLHASVLTMAQTTRSGRSSDSVNGSSRANNGALAQSVTPQAVALAADAYTTQNHNSVANLGPQNAVRLTMQPTLGLFTQDKLIPLPLVDPANPLVLVFTIATDADMGCWTANPGIGVMAILRASYVASLVEVGRDVIDQFRGVQELMGGQLVISGQDWEHASGVVPAATAGQIAVRMPARKRSIKSMFWTASDSNYAGGTGIDSSEAYNLSFCGNANVDSWQIKVGAYTYPPTPIQCWGNVAAVVGAGVVDPSGARGECLMELSKAFGTLGYTTPSGYLSTITYGTNIVGLSNGDNTDGGGNDLCPQGGATINVCPFGIDLESFQRTAIESGVDTQTLSQETNLILNVNGVGASPAPTAHNKDINMWVLYDQHYYFNTDGSVTFSN